MIDALPYKKSTNSGHYSTNLNAKDCFTSSKDHRKTNKRKIKYL